MAEKSLPVGGKRMTSLTDAVQALLSEKSEKVRQHSDRIVCITRFLCAQYTRTHGTKVIPVRDLPVIYAGAALHDMEWERVGELLEGCGLKAYECDIIENICLHHHQIRLLEGSSDRITLYTQMVALAECYEALTMGAEASCTYGQAMERIRGGEYGSFDPVLVRCMEDAYRELQALQECAGNHDRIVLLQNIYRGDRRHYWRGKRLFDVAASSVGFVVLLPVMMLIALAIVIDDPKGGPLFTQTRVGRHKKYFQMYKFRTMHIDAEEKKKALQELNEKDGPVFKIANDPRVTRVGRFLRKTSLDELPQLINILKGQMTLVGPRPPLPQEVARYTRYEEMRLAVTPGLTCVWQVQPERDKIPFSKWVDMDLAYIGTRSQWLDIWLVIRTVVSVFRQSGS